MYGYMSHPLYVLLAAGVGASQPPNGLAIKPILLMIMMMSVSVVEAVLMERDCCEQELEEQQH